MGKSRKTEAAESPLGVMEQQFRHRLNCKPVECPYGLEKPQRFGISCNENVLTVIDDVTGSRIGERIRAPAGGWTLFENKDREMTFGEADTRRQTADSPADNDDGLQ
jgi:hypothetical protein